MTANPITVRRTSDRIYILRDGKPVLDLSEPGAVRLSSLLRIAIEEAEDGDQT